MATDSMLKTPGLRYAGGGQSSLQLKSGQVYLASQAYGDRQD